MHSFIIFTVIVSFPLISGFCDNGWHEHMALCYFFSTSKKNYRNADMDCAYKQAQLVWTKNEVKNTFINETRVANQEYWIGLSRYLMGWIWSDNEPLHYYYTNWRYSTPVFDDRRTCAYMDVNGRWSNINTCRKRLRFICQKIARAYP